MNDTYYYGTISNGIQDFEVRDDLEGNFYVEGTYTGSTFKGWAKYPSIYDLEINLKRSGFEWKCCL